MDEKAILLNKPIMSYAFAVLGNFVESVGDLSTVSEYTFERIFHFRCYKWLTTEYINMTYYNYHANKEYGHRIIDMLDDIADSK
jgi:hypothetical protein